MKRNPHGKGARKKTVKTSLSKLSNKKLNKLAKQGKLKSKAHRRKLLGVLKERLPENANPNNSIEDDIPLEEADYSYYANPERSLSFLSNLAADDDDDHIESRYEKSKNQEKFAKKTKQLLPIKTKDGFVIPQAMEVEDQNTVEDSNTQEQTIGDNDLGEELQNEQKSQLSAVEQFAAKQDRIVARKDRIAALASAVTADPQQNMGKLRELVEMLGEDDAEVRPTVLKLVTVSLMEVFKDIIPEYRIRQQTEKEEQQQMKKETKLLKIFETSLLGNYKRYLEHLEHCVKGKMPQKRNKKTGVLIQLDVPKATIKTLQLLAVRCLCELLVVHPHFNFRTNIVAVLVPLMNHSNKQISLLVCDYVRRLFRDDRSGEVTLEIVRLIGRMIKSSGFRVKNYVIDTFLSLRLHAVSKDKESTNTKESDKKLMSKAQRKYKKQMAFLEKELADAAAYENKRKYNQIQSELISAVFLTYFRILKQARSSSLLSSVLAGLSKFAHLINVEFFDDLFSVLREIVQSDGVINNTDALHCIQTAMTILSGPQGSSLNIDPLMFYSRLYKIISSLYSANATQSEVAQAVECLDIMFSKRRKQITVSRLLAFAKRLGTASVHQVVPGCTLALLATLRVFHGLHPKMATLFDPEAAGSGLYMPELDEPDHCNAQNTAMFELTALRSHYHPTVRQYCRHVLAQCPIQGHHQLSASLMQRSAKDFVDFNTPDNLFDSTIPSSVTPSLLKRNESLSKLASNGECGSTLQSDNLEKIDFLSALTNGACSKKTLSNENS